MEEARAQVLDMVSRGRITVDEAEILLDALGVDVRAVDTAVSTPDPIRPQKEELLKIDVSNDACCVELELEGSNPEIAEEVIKLMQEEQS